MSNFESDGPPNGEWDDRGELAWNEFDWENYLREQDEIIHRYIGFYEKFKAHPDRIDQVAHHMGWDDESWSSDNDAASEFTPTESQADDAATVSADNEAEDSGDFDDNEPYTLHKNPIFIATKGIYLGLKRAWERIGIDEGKVPQSVAMLVSSSLYRGDEQATLAIQALDFGDYAMAISLFKRALRELNQTFSLLSDPRLEKNRVFQGFREDAMPRLFDLREIWLRVMNECREELERPVDDEDDEE